MVSPILLIGVSLLSKWKRSLFVGLAFMIYISLSYPKRVFTSFIVEFLTPSQITVLGNKNGAYYGSHSRFRLGAPIFFASTALHFLQNMFNWELFSLDNLLSEIKADVEKQLDLVSAASQHEDSVGAGGDAAALASARADLDTAISKLVTIQTLVSTESQSLSISS